MKQRDDQESEMEEGSNAPMCERGNDLIAYLYGEVDERESGSFELHLRSCEQCKVELGSFRQVRESIIGWRHESLGFVTGNALPVGANVPTGYEPGKRSALAAIRGFLDLSPLWMKAGVAFASIVFCVAAALAVTRLFDQPTPAIVAVEKRYTEAELKAIVAEAVAKERNLNVKSESSSTATASKSAQQKISGGSVNRPRQGAVASDGRSRQRPLTKSEREQLEADLRLISPDDDSDFELFGDRLNR